ncbi:MAG: regulatory signaling modulator protein AmpE [Pseudomonadales bacterium]
MKFLAILIVVLFYRHWTGVNPVREFIPLSSYLSWIRRSDLTRGVQYVVSVGLPALLLWLIVVFTRDWFAGLIWLLICVLVLLYAIEKVVERTAFDRQENWLRTIGEEDQLSSVVQYQKDFQSRVVYESFQNLHPPLLWFLILGPVGVLVYVVSRDYQAQFDEEDEKGSGLAATIVFWMEWIPARITGFIYALLGDFGRCFGEWLRWFADTSAEVGATLELWAESAMRIGDTYGEDVESFKRRAAEDIREMRLLLDRSVWGWVGLAAIVTVMGWS